MLIEIAKIQFFGTQEVKSFNKPCGHEPLAVMLLLKPEEAFASRLQVSSRHHALT